MKQPGAVGFVTLAGAGSGDPELITLKLQRRLQEADVILTDRLVNPAIVEAHAAPGAQVLLTGKKGYSEESMPQLAISELMMQYALEGKKVLRLKGGDVAFYSNVLDELEILHQHGVPFEIVPGITAASAASAYAGIPLTARGLSKGVQFLSFHASDFYASEKWKSLANSQDTLVFYMAARKVQDLTELLLRYTRQPQTPIAVVEQASTPQQQVFTSTLQSAATDFAGRVFASPSLVLVGKVVSLHASFKWFDHGHTTESSFHDLRQS